MTLLFAKLEAEMENNLPKNIKGFPFSANFNQVIGIFSSKWLHVIIEWLDDKIKNKIEFKWEAGQIWNIRKWYSYLFQFILKNFTEE